jgi:hypothetical protein
METELTKLRVSLEEVSLHDDFLLLWLIDLWYGIQPKGALVEDFRVR